MVGARRELPAQEPAVMQAMPLLTIRTADGRFLPSMI